MALPRLVVLVRHGQSEHHVQRLTGGWTESPLTALGHEQSRRLAARLKAELGDARIALHTSDLQRAAQTAAHIGEALGVEPIADARLREFDNGEAVNMTLDEARERFPGVFDFPWRIDDRPFPGAETGRELYERVSGFLDTLCAGDPVPVVVSHGAAIECMIAAWLKITPEALEPIGFVHHTTGVTTLTRDRFERPLIARLNDVSHLAGMDGWVRLDYVVPW
ncbi:MAG: histidine phosphatase family protein [Chloroflexota bacterium]|nr:histidine phosphatase family protein [Chloroflexota bacterium]